MFNTLKSKTIIPIVCIVVIMVLFITVYVSRAATNLADSLARERIIGASQTAEVYLDTLRSNNVMASRALAGSQGLIGFVRDWNAGMDTAQIRGGLASYLDDRKSDLGVDIFLVIDQQGNMILRTYEPERYGDYTLAAPHIAAALLQGHSSAAFSSFPALPMGLSGAAPIWDGGNIIGAIVVIVEMSTNEFVDNFGEVFNAEVTVFRGAESIASTLIHPVTNARAVGTEVAPHIAETVLNRGESLNLELMIFDRLPHHAYYFPLPGWGGNPIGMLFVGFSNEFVIDSTNALRRNLIFIGLVALVVTVIVMLLYLMWILKPLGLLTQSLGIIASGDANLTQRLPTKGKDEVARASSYFNRIMEEFQGMIISIKKQAGELSSIGDKLANSMADTASAMNQISANIQSIKGRVLNQSASVTETNATMEQVTVNIERLNDHVERQTSAVSESSAAIEEMLASIQSVTSTLVKNAVNVKELQESADEGKSSVQEVVADIQEIARESEGLLEINSVMENIASQTNLLSMNAAIEAAHAGDAGKGFAVVADEIRKLAESSSEQSKVIGNVLKKIKGSIDKITLSTDRVLNRFEAIDHGVKIVAEQEETIRNAMEEQSDGSRQVLHASSLVSEITQHVKGGSQKMHDGSKEVIQETQNLERATQEISGGMNEMATGAEQVNRAVSTVSELTDRTKEHIFSLVKSVSQFKV
ncbi:MAG: methyl-accepting chemotaxis protein [Treponema sp.]|nr:methyl-accepting chemotaxis protein [Treponema sp.]